MSDEGALFAFSLVMVIGAIAVAVLIAASGHVGFDEVFLLAACAVTAFAFGAYSLYRLRQAARRAMASRTTAAAPNAAERRKAA